MELATVGLKAQRRLHVRRSRIKFVLRHQHSGQIHVRFGISRFEAERDFILFFRLLPLALFLQGQPIIKMLFCADRHVCYEPCAPLDFWDHEMCLPKPQRTQRQHKYRRPF